MMALASTSPAEGGKQSAHYHASHMTADRLREARRLAGWSQRELARRAGVHAQTVKYWERRSGIIGGHAVRRFKEALLAAGKAMQEGFAPSPSEPLLAPFNAVRDTLTPEPLHGLPKPSPAKCGARTRKGTPCNARPVPGKRRCKFHGGLSTGARTPEGRERIAAAQRRRWQIAKGFAATPG